MARAGLSRKRCEEMVLMIKERMSIRVGRTESAESLLLCLPEETGSAVFLGPEARMPVVEVDDVHRGQSSALALVLGLR